MAASKGRKFGKIPFAEATEPTVRCVSSYGVRFHLVQVHGTSQVQIGSGESI